MAQQVNPRVFRLGVIQESDARWFARKESFKRRLQEDVCVRQFLLGRLKDALVDKVTIERTNQNMTIAIYAAKPGIIIGRAGVGIEDLKKKLLQNLFRGRRLQIAVNVHEVGRPGTSAAIVAQQVATDLEHRLPFRRVLKSTIERVMKAGAQGVRIKVGGRLNGAEIARDESLSVGKIPLQTLRADVSFARATAYTIFGTIGVKVWIYRGEVFKEAPSRSRADSSAPNF